MIHDPSHCLHQWWPGPVWVSLTTARSAAGPAVSIHGPWWRCSSSHDPDTVIPCPSVQDLSNTVHVREKCGSASWELGVGVYFPSVGVDNCPTNHVTGGCSVWGRGQKGGKYTVQGGRWRCECVLPSPAALQLTTQITLLLGPGQCPTTAFSKRHKRVKVIFVVLVNFVLGSVNSVNSAHLLNTSASEDWCVSRNITKSQFYLTKWSMCRNVQKCAPVQKSSIFLIWVMTQPQPKFNFDLWINRLPVSSSDLTRFLWKVGLKPTYLDLVTNVLDSGIQSPAETGYELVVRYSNFLNFVLHKSTLCNA